MYFIFVLICQTLSGHNGNKASNDKCPLSCQCKMSPLNNITRWKVTCDQKYWKRVPPLPYNTIELSMFSMPTLGSGSFTKTEGKTLRKLMLTDNKIPVTFESGSLRYTVFAYTLSYAIVSILFYFIGDYLNSDIQ